MRAKLKSGLSLVSIIVLTVVVIALVNFGKIFIDRFNLLPTTSQEQTGPLRLGGLEVIKAFPFKTSGGVKRNLVFVKANEAGAIPIVDTYITDDKLDSASAIKIPELSGDTSLGYAIFPSVPVGTNVLSVSVSPGSDKKILVILTSVGNGSTLTLIDEDGRLINDQAIAEVLDKLADKCPCKFAFDSWSDGGEFYLRTAGDNQLFKILIDARTGQIVGEIKNI